MGRRQLQWAAVAAFASSISGTLLLPVYLFTDSQSLQVGVTLSCLLLTVLVLLAFWRFSLHHLGFSHADWLIPLLLAGNTLLVFTSLVDEVIMVPPLFGVILAGGALSLIGVGYVLFGSLLLRVRHRLGGIGLPFCILQILMGVSFATMVLMPVGVFAAVISDLVLGVLFLHAAGREEALQAVR